MHRGEAEWVARALASVPAEALSPLLNIGSSTAEFRTRIQPWIEERLIAPLTARGVRLVHVDLKAAPGVDLAADIMDPAGFAAAQALNPKGLLLCNLLEHVPDAAAFAARCLALVPPGGYVVITVPRSYPHHRDPIDTMYRPTPQECAALFPGTEVLAQETIEVGSYRDQVRARPWILLRHVFRAPFPFLGFEKWRRSMGKLYWLANPYLTTCLVLRKASASS